MITGGQWKRRTFLHCAISLKHWRRTSSAWTRACSLEQRPFQRCSWRRKAQTKTRWEIIETCQKEREQKRSKSIATGDLYFFWDENWKQNELKLKLNYHFLMSRGPPSTTAEATTVKMGSETTSPVITTRAAPTDRSKPLRPCSRPRRAATPWCLKTMHKKWLWPTAKTTSVVPAAARWLRSTRLQSNLYDNCSKKLDHLIKET